MSYNLLNYSGSDSKAPYYKTIIDSTSPDIIVAQEVVGSSGYNQFLSEVLNVNGSQEWDAVPFINQSAQQDIALYYKKSVFSNISTTLATNAYSSGLRAAVEFKMEHTQSGKQIIFYGVHLKASSGSSNADIRTTEISRLRNRLDDLETGTLFVLCGDFNIYGSGAISGSNYTENVYSIVTEEGADPDGQAVDPIASSGTWHNSSTFAWLHTQSTRTTQLSDGGASGGLDDRFDFIFLSSTFYDSTKSFSYVDDSYISYGNDGRKFNMDINAGNNLKVSSTVADALYNASDHLPVLCDIRYIGESVSIESEYQSVPTAFKLDSPYPNPFNPTVNIPIEIQVDGEIIVEIFDVNGSLIHTLYNGIISIGEHTLSWNPENASSGLYFVRFESESQYASKKLIYLK